MFEGLERMIALLPEVYQPIFGHEHITASRTGHDTRIDALLTVTAELAEFYGRPLRVLDLGCAQGYISLRLAELGHHVVGVDFLEGNTDVATALAAENPTFDVGFITADVSDVESHVELTDFDLVVAFSVIHHLLHRDGEQSVDAFVSHLATAVPNAVVELALPDEPLYWADALPVDPRHTVQAWDFIRQIGWSDTHLSSHRRPVFFCSRELALIDGNMVRIQTRMIDPHDQADDHARGLRRYFRLVNGTLVKTVANYDGAEPIDEHLMNQLRLELRQERAMLGRLPHELTAGMDFVEFVESSDDAILARKEAPGALLSTVNEFLTDDELETIAQQLLTQLALLEASGYYHGDVRTWNVVWDQTTRSARLIDLGAVTADRRDVVWPYDPLYSAFMFMLALWSRRPDQNGIGGPRGPRVDIDTMPSDAIDLLSIMLVTEAGPRWFGRVLDAWRARADGGAAPPTPDSWRWLSALTNEVEELRLAGKKSAELLEQLERLAKDRERALATAQAEIEGLAPERQSLRAQLDAMTAARDSLLGQARDTEQRLAQCHIDRAAAVADYETIRASESYRVGLIVTSPFRLLATKARRVLVPAVDRGTRH